MERAKLQRQMERLNRLYDMATKEGKDSLGLRTQHRNMLREISQLCGGGRKLKETVQNLQKEVGELKEEGVRKESEQEVQGAQAEDMTWEEKYEKADRVCSMPKSQNSGKGSSKNRQ